MSNYSRGADFERRVQKRFDEDGFFTLRSAGSHSLIDVVAFKAGMVFLIQCKTDGMLSVAERQQLQELRRETGCLVYLISRQGRKMISEEIKEEKNGG